MSGSSMRFVVQDALSGSSNDTICLSIQAVYCIHAVGPLRVRQCLELRESSVRYQAYWSRLNRPILEREFMTGRRTSRVLPSDTRYVIV